MIPKWLDILSLVIIGSVLLFGDLFIEYIWIVLITRQQGTYEFWTGRK